MVFAALLKVVVKLAGRKMPAKVKLTLKFIVLRILWQLVEKKELRPRY